MTSYIKRLLVSVFFISFVAFGFQIARGQSSRGLTPFAPPRTDLISEPPSPEAPNSPSNSQANSQPSSQPTTQVQGAAPAPTTQSAAQPPAQQASPPVASPNANSMPPQGSMQAPAPGPQGLLPANPQGQQLQIAPAPQPLAHPTFPGAPPTFPGAPPPAAGEARPFVPSEVISEIPPTEKSWTPKLTFHTTQGSFTVVLNRVEAPLASQNIIDLATGQRPFIDIKTSKKATRPYYNGLIVHRVIHGDLIQMGCPFGTGRGGPGYILNDEFSANMKFDRPDVVAMAAQREGATLKANTNGSQFLITLRPMPELDGKLTIIGHVDPKAGMDTILKIAASKVGPTGRPIRRIYINSVDVRE